MRRATAIIATGVLLGIVPQAGAASGGTYASMAGVIAAAGCTTGCAGLDAARAGATITVTGTDLGAVTRIVFMGTSAVADDVSADVTPISATELTAVVPPGAVTGKVMVLNSDGNQSAPSPRPLRITTATAPHDGVVHAKVSASTVYYDGTNPATLRYFVDTTQIATVTVSLIHGRHGSTVTTWPAQLEAPGTVGTVTWDGAASSSPSGIASEGHYSFQVAVAQSGTVRAASEPQSVGAFTFLPDVFPVQGKHTFNMGSGRFGAPRDGHVHEGQDVMANCGLPIVAARGGTIEKVAVDVNAGNYVVIDTAGSGIDMVYAHLRYPSPLKEGDPVLSGQQIGVVGRTGDATACHLHFEEWTAPGWFKGGHPFDPLPDLRRWERESRAARAS